MDGYYVPNIIKELSWVLWKKTPTPPSPPPKKTITIKSHGIRGMDIPITSTVGVSVYHIYIPITSTVGISVYHIVFQSLLLSGCQFTI